jgi:hypothetical protein
MYNNNLQMRPHYSWQKTTTSDCQSGEISGSSMKNDATIKRPNQIHIFVNKRVVVRKDVIIHDFAVSTDANCDRAMHSTAMKSLAALNLIKYGRFQIYQWHRMQSGSLKLRSLPT